MKKVIMCLIAFILIGCAGGMPDKADLNIDIGGRKAKIYPTSLGVSVIGRDDRNEPYIIVYQVENKPVTTLTSRVPVKMLVKEGLFHGLRQQGLQQDDNSNIAIVIVVKELMAKVTKPGMLYSAQARSHLQLIVGNNGSTLTLDYRSEASKDSLTRPKVLDLEMMINGQLSTIVSKILSDDRVRTAIIGGS